MPSISSRFVQFGGLVRLLSGKILTSKGSRISHSGSVKLLEYGTANKRGLGYDLTLSL